MSKEKDWLYEVIGKTIVRLNGIRCARKEFPRAMYESERKELANSIRQELVRRIEGKKKFYCEIHGIKQRRDKCIRCCETFMYREAIDEIIKEIS